MTNASNNVFLMGTVMTNVQFLTTKQGIEFAARFMLSVKKGYKNKDGFYATDLIPIRIKGEKRMGFAKMIHKGDKVCLSGSVSAEKYNTKDGNSIFSVLIDADHIEWTGVQKFQNSESKEMRSEEKEIKMSTENYMDKSINNTIKIELPFS